MTLLISRGYNGVSDPDAAAYVAAVEAADGQLLENAVGKAINSFVIGCKNDGIWNAIKASCILAGARTRQGALIPLANASGVAPTFNGTAGGWNYNRKTGLAGNGTDNYIASGRNNTADPQNNKHISLYGSFSVPSGSYQAAIGAPYSGTGWTSILIDNRATSGIQPWVSGDNYAGGGMIPIFQSGFIGATRSTSTVINSRANLTNYSRNVNSSNVVYGIIDVHRSGTDYTNGRLAFYSIGESLDLALLDARVTRLIAEIAFAINTGISGSSYDLDTLNYINGGYAAGGSLA